MGNTWTLVLQCLKPKEILNDVVYQTRIWGDNSGTPNSVNNLMHNWASPKSLYETIEWQTLKAQNPKTPKFPNWSWNEPAKLTVPWMFLGEFKRILETNKTWVSQRLKPKDFLKKPLFHKLTSESCFYNSDLIKCLWGSPKLLSD